MKRTREKTEVMEEEEIRSQMFDSEVISERFYIFILMVTLVGNPSYEGGWQEGCLRA